MRRTDIKGKNIVTILRPHSDEEEMSCNPKSQRTSLERRLDNNNNKRVAFFSNPDP